MLFSIRVNLSVLAKHNVMLNNIIKLLVHLLKECKKKRSARSTSSSINKYANINKEIHFIINTYLVDTYIT